MSQRPCARAGVGCVESAIYVLLAALCVESVENVGLINVGLVFVGRRGQVHVGYILEQGLSQLLVAGIVQLLAFGTRNSATRNNAAKWTAECRVESFRKLVRRLSECMLKINSKLYGASYDECVLVQQPLHGRFRVDGVAVEGLDVEQQPSIRRSIMRLRRAAAETGSVLKVRQLDVVVGHFHSHSDSYSMYSKMHSGLCSDW